MGLAVMGANLARNAAHHGFGVAVFNRNPERTDDLIAQHGGEGRFFPAKARPEFIASIAKPRPILIMVKAGKPVDEVIDELLPHLEEGDIIIDGGNSHFPDTIRRTKALEEKGFLYVGTGVSGGEEGALLGPSIMPGGSRAAWPAVKPIFQAIAAKVEDGTPCCDWVGDNGAGHFVKMVHNGIEYGDMQLICESYQMMKELLGMSADEMHGVFKVWNTGDLDSFLIEITRDILAFKDTDGTPMVDKILDTAGQKGTGKWTSVTAMDLGMPLTLISEAVYARCLSATKDERVAASKILRGPTAKFTGDRKAFIADLEKALYCSKVISYAQGYEMMRAAAGEYKWDLSYGGIALLWRGGCIIRSTFLGKIKEAYDKDPGLSNLLLAPFFQEKIQAAQESWRRVVATAATYGVWIPAHATALTYFDGFRNGRLPANLLQAQRDYFGAHMYERIDQPRGKFFHTNWTGRGGTTSSSAYVV
jgi:6-phosphogluconate dehydrogenase